MTAPPSLLQLIELFLQWQPIAPRTARELADVTARLCRLLRDEVVEARAWAAEFVRWYNVDHRHSGIRYVSPAQRHAGQDKAILAARHALYLQAKQCNPARWSGNTRDWSHIGAVTLNPERDTVVDLAVNTPHTQQKAA